MSVRSLGSLTLDMVLKTGNFTGPMDKAQRDTQRKMRQMEKDAKMAAAGIAAIAAGAAAGAAGLYAYAKSNMDTIDANAKLARSLGGTIDGLRAVNMAASDSGLDGMEASLNRMNRRLGAVEMNGGPALKTVERLKLNLQEMKGMDVDQQLAYVADRIRDSGVSAQEAARHLQQLGFEQRGATELFLKGGDAIRNARQEIEDYGLSVSMVDAAAIEDANDAIARMGLSSEALGNAVAVRLAPSLHAMADSVNDVTKAFHAGDYDLQLEVMKGIAVGVAGAAGAYVTYRVAVNAATIAQWAFNAAIRVNPLGALVTVAGAAVGAIYTFREELGLVSPKIQSATDRVDDMTSALDANSQAALKNAKAMLEAERQFQQFRQTTLAMAVSNQREIVAEEQRQWNSVGGQQAFGMGQRSEAQQALHDLQVELMDTRNAIEAAGGSVAEIDAKLAELGNTTRETTQTTEDQTSESERATKAIANQIAALQMQAKTLGMAEDEMVLYKLAQEGATDAQLASARVALETISAYEASEKAAEDYRALLVELRTTEERLTAQVAERLAVLDAANVAGEEYAEVAAKIAVAGFADAPSYGGLDATIGGAFGELNKIAEAENQLQEWYATQLDMLNNYRQERADLTEQWNEQERALKEKHEAELARIEKARQIAQLAGAESLFGDMASITKAFAGEQSGIYKAMFAAEKAFAIASSIVSIQQGIAGAAALPFPANIPAMASVAAATAGIVTTIQGTGLAGMAHDGIDSIPETGTWLLEKGEKVTTASTSAKLDRTLDDTNAKMDAMLARTESQMNRPGGSDSGSGFAPVVHVDARGSTNPAETARLVGDAVRQSLREVAQDFNDNGPLRQQLGV
ncbi:hypothetical protein HW452_16595 [Halomonas aquamarina]|uniref:Uncharacterized protein n=1 Tax=Vreelandella aquamarina TaxID=77097 RepID=A0ACC5VY12_9GAMM|nr:hypothetical protein [Halomonas aquamarina]MBZ5489140.1 hypothetical protein [Halomonas aquamarina]